MYFFFFRFLSAAVELLKRLQSVIASTAVSDALINSLQMSVELAALSNIRQQEVHERFEDMLVAIDELGDFFSALCFWKVVLCSGVSFLAVVGAGASLGEYSPTTALSGVRLKRCASSLARSKRQMGMAKSRADPSSLVFVYSLSSA
jgi:hypothetical protein